MCTYSRNLQSTQDSSHKYLSTYMWQSSFGHVHSNCICSTFHGVHTKVKALPTTASKGRPQHVCTCIWCTTQWCALVVQPCRFLCNELYELIRVMWSGKWVSGTAMCSLSYDLTYHLPTTHHVHCLLSYLSRISSFHLKSHYLLHVMPLYCIQCLLLCAAGCGDPRDSPEHTVAGSALLPWLLPAGCTGVPVVWTRHTHTLHSAAQTMLWKWSDSVSDNLGNVRHDLTLLFKADEVVVGMA